MTDESSERVISYATPMREPYDATAVGARDLFGVVVRSVGLGLTVWGAYSLFYLLLSVTVDAPLDGQTRGSMLLFAAFLLVAGFALLRGEWVVRFAYRLPPAD